MDTPAPSLPDAADITERARRRVGRKLGFYAHAAVFVVVNGALFAINTVQGGPRWAVFPFWGWGLGLAIHGAATWISLRGEGLRDRMVDAEIRRLRGRG